MEPVLAGTAIESGPTPHIQKNEDLVSTKHQPCPEYFVSWTTPPVYESSSSNSLRFTIRPFHDMESESRYIPLVDYGPQIIPRCFRCHAFINPYIHWIEVGRRWICSLCGLENTTDGYCQDAVPFDEHPELVCGCVDYVARVATWSTPYAVLFVVDIGQLCTTSGMAETFVGSIERAVKALVARAPDARIGFIAFDTHVYHFMIKPGRERCTVVCAADTTDPMTVDPPVDEILVRANALLARTDVPSTSVEEVLRILMYMCRENAKPASAFRMALASGIEYLSKNGGGGCGHLVVCTANELDATPAQQRELTIRCIDANVVLDFFVNFSPPRTSAPMETLARATCGQLFNYSAHISDQGAHLRHTLETELGRHVHVCSAMRIRGGGAMWVQGWKGNLIACADDRACVKLPYVHADSVITANCVFATPSESPLPSCVVVQLVMISSTLAHSRTMRVMTVCIPLADIY